MRATIELNSAELLHAMESGTLQNLTRSIYTAEDTQPKSEEPAPAPVQDSINNWQTNDVKPEEEDKISQADFRAKLVEKTKAGKLDEVKATLKEYGYDNVSAVKEKDYREIIEKVEKL